jgi:signal peptidase I
MAEHRSGREHPDPLDHAPSTTATAGQASALSPSVHPAVATWEQAGAPIAHAAVTCETPDGLAGRLVDPAERSLAAHLSCYAMGLAHALAEAGTPPTTLRVQARSSPRQLEGGGEQTAVDLEVHGQVPGLEQAAFRKLASRSDLGCPAWMALLDSLDIRLRALLGGPLPEPERPPSERLNGGAVLNGADVPSSTLVANVPAAVGVRPTPVAARRVVELVDGQGMMWELVQAVLVSFVAFLAIQAVVQNFRVDGPSMEPTFVAGQNLLILKAAYFHVDGTPLEGRLPSTSQGSVDYLFGGPQRGDIAVFRAPTVRNTDYLKRIIGLPGDEVLIRNGVVWLNGERLSEPYVQFIFPRTYGYPDDGEPVAVPDGSYFVLGDNRPNSFDSSEGWLVPVENLVGRVWLSYWPPSTWGIVSR